MKVLRRLTWGSAKFWMGAIAVVTAALLVSRDGAPTNASSTEILPSLSNTAPVYSSTLLLVKGGHLSSLYNPCDPGGTGPTTACLHVWAANVSNSTGASAFQVHVRYPTNLVTVSGFAPSTTWLASTGRSVACNSVFASGDGTFYCNTLNSVPPFGATGSGMLVNLAIESTDQAGIATLNFDPLDPNSSCASTSPPTCDTTYLVDTPPDSINYSRIPATVRSLTVASYPCADMNGNGVVTAADILYVVQKYGTNDALGDLNGDGVVTASDILITVKEFSFVCTR